jgi:hypothetical protein
MQNKTAAACVCAKPPKKIAAALGISPEQLEV